MDHNHIGPNAHATIELCLDKDKPQFYLRIHFTGMRIGHVRPPHRITPYGLHLTMALVALEGVMGVIKFDDRTFLVLYKDVNTFVLRAATSKAINEQGYAITLDVPTDTQLIKLP